MSKQLNLSEKKNISFGAIISYLTIFVSIIMSFFYTRYILENLGEVNCSIRNIATSATSYLSLISLGMGVSYFRFRTLAKKDSNPNSEKKFNGVFLIMYIIFGILSLLLGFIIIIAAKFGYFKVADSSKTYLLIPVIGITVLSTSINFPLMVFGMMENYHRKFIFSNSINLLDTILLPALSMLAIFILNETNTPENLTIIITWIAFGEGILIKIIHIFYVIFHLKDRISFKLKKSDFKIVKSMIAFSFFAFIVTSMSKIHTSTDQVILSGIISTTAALYYSYAMLFHTYTNTATSTIINLFVPRITEDAINKNEDDMNKIFCVVSAVITILVMLLIGGFISCGREFISIWLSSLSESECKNIYIYAVLLMSCCTLSTYSSFLFEFHIANNQHRFASLLYILSFLINIGVSVGLCYVWGIYGVIAGTIFVTIVEAIGMSVYSKKKTKLNLLPYFANLVKNLLISIGSSLIVLLVFKIINVSNLNLILVFAIKGSLFVLLFGCCQFIFNRKFVIDFAKKLFKKEQQ